MSASVLEVVNARLASWQRWFFQGELEVARNVGGRVDAISDVYFNVCEELPMEGAELSHISVPAHYFDAIKAMDPSRRVALLRAAREVRALMLDPKSDPGAVRARMATLMREI